MSILMGPLGPVALVPREQLPRSLRALSDARVRYVPDDADDLRRWITLEPTTGSSSICSFPFHVNYNTGRKMLVRIQGVVSDCLLQREGDGGGRGLGLGARWDPLMYLRLVPGYRAWRAPFRLQFEVLSTVVNAVFEKAGLDAACSIETLPASLVLRRRIWGRTGEPAPLPILQYLSNAGNLRLAKKGDIQAGDLVDVTVEFDFVVHKAADGIPRSSVFLSFTRIVRLGRCLDLQLARGMGTFRPALVFDRYDYVDRANIGYTDPVYVDAGYPSPDADMLHIASNGNTDPRELPSTLRQEEVTKESGSEYSAQGDGIMGSGVDGNHTGNGLGDTGLALGADVAGDGGIGIANEGGGGVINDGGGDHGSGALEEPSDGGIGTAIDGGGGVVNDGGDGHGSGALDEQSVAGDDESVKSDESFPLRLIPRRVRRQVISEDEDSADGSDGDNVMEVRADNLRPAVDVDSTDGARSEDDPGEGTQAAYEMGESGDELNSVDYIDQEAINASWETDEGDDDIDEGEGDDIGTGDEMYEDIDDYEDDGWLVRDDDTDFDDGDSS